MTHQGRVHTISTEAEEISKRILGAVPKDKIVYGRLRRPLWHKIEFQDTADERRYLTEVACRYNSQSVPCDNLIAHGTEDSSTLCQILLNRKLKHNVGIENYGNLASTESIQVGGYWDRGWGLFVATPKTIQNYEIERYLVVPTQKLKGILLPGPLVEVVQREFPDQASKLRSYLQFAQEIEELL